MKKIGASASAIELIQKLKSKHGPILFHQSGGCCDGSVPICISINELSVGQSDFYIGDIAGFPVI